VVLSLDSLELCSKNASEAFEKGKYALCCILYCFLFVLSTHIRCFGIVVPSILCLYTV
jgi:hypothetical protein